ncbi:respiratory nitrate reductase subunit gamma [Streptomyces sp. NBC_01180]|uniref:respiratory nitrate reductase subunit gamma n=1 Tax=unclassified Streptomyces TaxID=2593676 RepID=UPI00386A4226
MWFRSLVTLDPDVPAIPHAPLIYQAHTLLAITLLTLSLQPPDTRLHHTRRLPARTHASSTAHPPRPHRTAARQPEP